MKNELESGITCNNRDEGLLGSAGIMHKSCGIRFQRTGLLPGRGREHVSSRTHPDL